MKIGAAESSSTNQEYFSNASLILAQFLKACVQGNNEVAEAFLKKHSGIILKGKSVMDTAITTAVENENFSLLKILLNYGGDPYAMGSRNFTPLEILSLKLNFQIKSLENKQKINIYLEVILFILTKNNSLCNHFGVDTLKYNLEELYKKDLLDAEYIERFKELGFSLNSHEDEKKFYDEELRKSFFEACENGDTKKIKKMLSAEPGLTYSVDQQRDTAFQIACGNGDLRIVVLLLEEDPNVIVKASNGLTPIEMISSRLQNFLEKEKNSSQTVQDYLTIVTKILCLGGNPNLENSEGSSILHVLIDIYEKYYVPSDILEKFVNPNYFPVCSDPNQPDRNGMLPFQRALKLSTAKINTLGRIFIRHGAKLFPWDKILREELFDIINSYKVFMRIIGLHELDNIKRFGGDKDLLDEELKTVLYESISKFSSFCISKKNILELLPKRGKYLNLLKITTPFIPKAQSQKQVKITGLFYAIDIGCTELIEILIERNPKILSEIKGEHTPLMRACRQKDFTIIKLLVKKGGNINQKVQNKNAFVILMDLLEKQIDKNPRNRKLILIFDTLILFLRHEADPNILSSQGESLISLFLRLHTLKPEMFNFIKDCIDNSFVGFDLHFMQENISVVERILSDNKADPILAAFLLTELNFYKLEDLYFKHSATELEKVKNLLNRFKELQSEFKVPFSREVAQNIFSLANEIHDEFKKINCRKESGYNLLNFLYDSNLVGVVARSYSFNEEDRLILSFNDPNLLTLMEERLIAQSFKTEVIENSLKITLGNHKCNLSQTQIQNFCKRYNQSARTFIEAQNEAQKGDGQGQNSTTQNSNNNDLPASKTAQSKVQIVQEKRRFNKKKLKMQLAENRRLEKKSRKNSQLKTKASAKLETKKFEGMENFAKEKNSETPYPLIAEKARTILDFPETDQTDKNIQLPISGDRGYVEYRKNNAQESQVISPKKCKKFEWLPVQVKRIRIAQSSLQGCKTLALKLQKEKFVFTDDLFSQIYKKTFEYRFLKALDALMDSQDKDNSKDSELLEAFSKYALNPKKLREMQTWLAQNFPLILGKSLYKLSLKFSLARIPAILGKLLNEKMAKKPAEKLNLENVDFHLEFSKLLKNANKDKKLLSEMNKEIEFLENAFKAANNSTEIVNSEVLFEAVKKSLFNILFFSDHLTPQCASFQGSAQMAQLITWGKMVQKEFIFEREVLPTEVLNTFEFERIRKAFHSKSLFLQNLRTQLGIQRFAVAEKRPNWWL